MLKTLFRNDFYMGHTTFVFNTSRRFAFLFTFNSILCAFGFVVAANHIGN